MRDSEDDDEDEHAVSFPEDYLVQHMAVYSKPFAGLNKSNYIYTVS